MNRLMNLCAAAALFGLAACSSTTTTNPITSNEAPSRAYHAAHNVPSHGVALEGYCPVAYFAVNKPVRGKPEYASTHKGITYHLLSADAKAAFDEDPNKYLPAYGGWCAFGMSVQDKFPVDPRNFQIVDGRLNLFLKNEAIDARDLWNEGEERDQVLKAESHWRTVQG